MLCQGPKDCQTPPAAIHKYSSSRPLGLTEGHQACEDSLHAEGLQHDLRILPGRVGDRALLDTTVIDPLHPGLQPLHHGQPLVFCKPHRRLQSSGFITVPRSSIHCIHAFSPSTMGSPLSSARHTAGLTGPQLLCWLSLECIACTNCGTARWCAGGLDR